MSRGTCGCAPKWVGVRVHLKCIPGVLQLYRNGSASKKNPIILPKKKILKMKKQLRLGWPIGWPGFSRWWLQPTLATPQIRSCSQPKLYLQMTCDHQLTVTSLDVSWPLTALQRTTGRHYSFNKDGAVYEHSDALTLTLSGYLHCVHLLQRRYNSM